MCLVLIVYEFLTADVISLEKFSDRAVVAVVASCEYFLSLVISVIRDNF